MKIQFVELVIQYKAAAKQNTWNSEISKVRTGYSINLETEKENYFN